MTDLYTQLFIFSTFILFFTLVSKHIKEYFYLPETLISLLFGILTGTKILNLVFFNKEYLFYISRIILCIQTMNVALSLPKNYIKDNYKSLFVVVCIVGIFKCVFTFLVFLFINLIAGSLKVNFKYYWYLASALTPTDPILSSSIIKGKFASTKIPNRIRLLLQAESGINDGLGIILINIPNSKGILDFIFNIVFCKIVVSIVVGIILGKFFLTIFKFSYNRNFVGMDSFMLHTFLVNFICISLMEKLKGSEFICIFFCGIQFSSDEFIIVEYDTNMQEMIDIILSVIFFFLFGTIINFKISLLILILAIIIICIRRPLICYYLRDYISLLNSRNEALFIGWFGPIGVGALYYSMMVDRICNSILFSVASQIVFVSVLIHGLTVFTYKVLNLHLINF